MSKTQTPSDGAVQRYHNEASGALIPPWSGSNASPVARRVLATPMRIAPGFATYPLRLHHPGARLLFANSVSLLPGTLAVDLRDDCLAIHALDRDSDFTAELRRVESAVGRVFGEAL